MHKYFSRVSLTERAIPVALLFVTIASFGLLIPWLGFYWDDWPVLYMAQTQGSAGFQDFYQYDRPFSAWTYILFAPLLGTSPLAWHIFTLLLRWLTSVFLWGSLRQIWPHKPLQAFWTAVLFAVAPLFTRQSVAVAYSQHWLCYLLFFASIYFMLRALRQGRYSYLFSALAVFLSALQLLTMEYFVGLELLRPLILWFYFRGRESGAPARHVFKRVAASSWIYIVLLVAYVVWRVFFLRLAGDDPNRPELLEKLFTAPLAGLLALTQIAIRDFIFLVMSWGTGLRPANIELQRPFSVMALAVAVISAMLFRLVASRYALPPHEPDDDGWSAEAMILGTLAIFFGMLPVWMIDRQASVSLLGSRFSLAATFGVSLLFVGLLDWLSSKNRVKLTVISLLVAVAIHTNLYAAEAYQQSWEKQRTFYWQLSWRAPYIQPDTALIADGEIFKYVGLYSTSMGINLLYPSVDPPQAMPYWFFEYGDRLFKIPDEIVAGTILEGGLRNYSFRGDSKNAILLDFSPELNRCLHLLSPHDENDRDLPESMQRLLSVSNLSRIEREAPGGWKPPVTIFGPEPQRTWCYYFEKADLAYQYEDWEEVLRLMEEAREQGFGPTDMKEYLPWLDAYLKTGRVEPARSLSLQMMRLSNKIDDRVCEAWLDALEANTDPGFNAAFENVREKSGCFD